MTRSLSTCSNMLQYHLSTYIHSAFDTGISWIRDAPTHMVASQSSCATLGFDLLWHALPIRSFTQSFGNVKASETLRNLFLGRLCLSHRRAKEPGMSVLHHKASAALPRGLKDSVQISMSGHCASMYASNKDNDAVISNYWCVNGTLGLLLQIPEISTARSWSKSWSICLSFFLQPDPAGGRIVLFAVIKYHKYHDWKYTKLTPIWSFMNENRLFFLRGAQTPWRSELGVWKLHRLYPST